jgi:hypothetical protein
MHGPNDELRPPADGGWFWLENSTVEGISVIGVPAFVVYCVLAYHADNTRSCFPTHKIIRQLSRLRKDTVNRAIKTLESNGWISVERRGGHRNTYRLPPLQGNRKREQPPDVTGRKREPPVVANRNQGVVANRNHEQDLIEQDPINKTFSCRTLRFDEEDMAIARWMHDLNAELQPGRKPPKYETWANHIRLMRERDGRTRQEIRDLYVWCHQDEFWQANILSPSKLREKWDDLTLRKEKRRRNNERHADGAGPGKRYDPHRADRDEDPLNAF